MRGSLSGAAGEEERASILFIHLFIYFDGAKQHYIPLRMNKEGARSSSQLRWEVELGGVGGGDHVSHKLSSEQNPGSEGGSCIINV